MSAAEVGERWVCKERMKSEHNCFKVSTLVELKNPLTLPYLTHNVWETEQSL